MVHVCVPLAAVITRLTLAPAARVMLAPLAAVAFMLPAASGPSAR